MTYRPQSSLKGNNPTGSVRPMSSIKGAGFNANPNAPG